MVKRRERTAQTADADKIEAFAALAESTQAKKPSLPKDAKRDYKAIGFLLMSLSLPSLSHCVRKPSAPNSI